MRWMTLAVVVLLFGQPGNAVAGPPEVSGKMVMDEVGQGLDRFMKEADRLKRLNCFRNWRQRETHEWAWYSAK